MEWSCKEGSFDPSGPMLGSAAGDTVMTMIALALPPLPQQVYSPVEETDSSLGSDDPDWAGLGQGNTKVPLWAGA